MILGWEGVDGFCCPKLHLHGARDVIIPIRKVHPDVVFPDGGHMINWTHAEQVNEIICRFLDGLDGAAA
jgi:pimeloyl-ACP methyl ester carboxylesterase